MLLFVELHLMKKRRNTQVTQSCPQQSFKKILYHITNFILQFFSDCLIYLFFLLFLEALFVFYKLFLAKTIKFWMPNSRLIDHIEGELKMSFIVKSIISLLFGGSLPYILTDPIVYFFAMFIEADAIYF